MVIKEEKRDLFSVSDEYYLAHCISADFGMASGIVVEFNKRFNMRNEIRELYPKGYKGVGCVVIGRVLNLITKNRYWSKPTYQTLESALHLMKEECIAKGIKKVAMPKIGCGLDKLEWFRVKELITGIFEDLDIEILVCYL